MTVPATLSLLIVCLVSSLEAQAPPPVTPADSAFVRGDWVTARRLYRSTVQRDSTAGRAWFRMAIAAQASRDLPSAIEGYRRAIALNFQQPAATYRLAMVEALAGHADTSVALLERAVAAGATPSGRQLLKQPEFASLHSNAVYRRLVVAADSAAFPCLAAPAAHRLDFWIGQWDVTPWNGAPVPGGGGRGFNEIYPILGHCVLLENWTGGLGSSGKSFNWFDTNLNKWRQAWMSDGGGPLDYVGEYKDGAMRFEGWTLNPDGSHMLQKLTFFNISADTVRQLFEQSADSGKTWQSTFDGRYVRHKGARTAR